MKSLIPETQPLSEASLKSRCAAIEGLTFEQLAENLGRALPPDPKTRKGWIGQAIERALGATSGSKSQPDFPTLGIELKTLPIASSGKPAESTFITTIPLLTIHQQQWKTSQCYAKLQRVLWIPIEGDKALPYQQRRIGSAIFWSPNAEEEQTLAADWMHLTTMITTGQLETIDARQGEYLQVRPKAANGKSLCYGFDAKGNKVLTLPRGFYLRSSFTALLI